MLELESSKNGGLTTAADNASSADQDLSKSNYDIINKELELKVDDSYDRPPQVRESYRSMKYMNSLDILRASVESNPEGPAINRGDNQFPINKSLGMPSTRRSYSGSDPLLPGSMVNLCERRLAFELHLLPSPREAASALISKVTEIASGRSENRENNIQREVGFISCQELFKIFSHIGLRMSMPEVESLATGFASDSKGGINARELCEAVRVILHSFQRERAAEEAEFRRSRDGNDYYASDNNAAAALRQEDRVDLILLELCEDILTKDKKSAIGSRFSKSSASKFKTRKAIHQFLQSPFLQEDDMDRGVLNYGCFLRAMTELGSRLSKKSTVLVARRFPVRASGARREYVGGRGFNGGGNVRGSREQSAERAASRDLSGLGRASEAGDMQPRWAGIDSMRGSAEGSVLGSGGDDGPGYDGGMLVEVAPLVDRLTTLLDALIAYDDEHDRVAKEKQRTLPWAVQEFALFDELLRQLEHMRGSGERRRALMALQYAFTSGDERLEGEADGFTVLNALVSAGFKVSREERVRLFQLVEEMGGKINYNEFLQVLLRHCSDWSQREHHLVGKILSTMGVTVMDRRAWLSRLRHELMMADKTSSLYAQKRGRVQGYGHVGSSWDKLELNSRRPGNDLRGDDDNPGIPPADFLKCLRDCGVLLSVEDEAILLDCLDLESLSAKNRSQPVNVDDKHDYKSVGRIQSNWSTPLIHYKSFLLFCARHCGHWSDVSPDLTFSLKEALACISNTHEALHEFHDLLRSFDDNDAGTVSGRSFEIAAHRARLFAELAESDIKRLSDILVADGGGRVRYVPFVLYLKGICTTHRESPESLSLSAVLTQLLDKASDKALTLLPLRNWLIKHTDTESCIMSTPDLVRLLKHFHVSYREEDLQLLRREIKFHPEKQSKSRDSSILAFDRPDVEYMSSRYADVDTAVDDYNLGEYNYRDDSVGRRDKNASPLHRDSLDTRALLKLLMALRGSWCKLHKTLAERMSRLLSIAGAQRFSSSASAAFSYNGDDDIEANDSGSSDWLVRASHKGRQHPRQNQRDGMAFTRSSKGVETAAARFVMSRLYAFADIGPVEGTPVPAAHDGSGGSSGYGNGGSITDMVDRETRMLERDVFFAVVRASGIPLTQDDALLLADATDAHPAATRVSCDVFLEAIHFTLSRLSSSSSPSHGDRSDLNIGDLPAFQRQRDTDAEYTASVAVIQTIRKALRNTALVLNRSEEAWEADVRAVFRGFDSAISGFISTEDFVLALQLLGVSLSLDQIRSLPSVPDGPGLVPYRAILEELLNNNSGVLRAAAGSAAAYDAVYGPNVLGKNKVNGLETAKELQGDGIGSPSMPIAVVALVRVVRRSLRHYLVSVGAYDNEKMTKVTDDILDTCWMHLLNAFKSFDPKETNVVTSRDFGLAVSVLIEGDNIVLDEEDWDEIFTYFATGKAPHTKERPTVSSSNGASGDSSESLGTTGQPKPTKITSSTAPPLVISSSTKIDYMQFCESVLDPASFFQVLTQPAQHWAEVPSSSRAAYPLSPQGKRDSGVASRGSVAQGQSRSTNGSGIGDMGPGRASRVMSGGQSSTGRGGRALLSSSRQQMSSAPSTRPGSSSAQTRTHEGPRVGRRDSSNAVRPSSRVVGGSVYDDFNEDFLNGVDVDDHDDLLSTGPSLVGGSRAGSSTGPSRVEGLRRGPSQGKQQFSGRAGGTAGYSGRNIAAAPVRSARPLSSPAPATSSASSRPSYGSRDAGRSKEMGAFGGSSGRGHNNDDDSSAALMVGATSRGPIRRVAGAAVVSSSRSGTGVGGYNPERRGASRQGPLSSNRRMATKVIEDDAGLKIGGRRMGLGSAEGYDNDDDGSEYQAGMGLVARAAQVSRRTIPSKANPRAPGGRGDSGGEAFFSGGNRSGEDTREEVYEGRHRPPPRGLVHDNYDYNFNASSHSHSASNYNADLLYPDENMDRMGLASRGRGPSGAPGTAHRGDLSGKNRHSAGVRFAETM